MRALKMLSYLSVCEHILIVQNAFLLDIFIHVYKMLIMFIALLTLSLSTFFSVPNLSPLSKNYEWNHPIFVFLSLSEILVAVVHFSILLTPTRFVKRLPTTSLKQHHHHRAVPMIAQPSLGGLGTPPAPCFYILTPVKPKWPLSVSSM